MTSKRVPKSLMKSIQIEIWASRCPLGVPVDLWITKMVTQGGKLNLQVFKMTGCATKFQQATSQQLAVHCSSMQSAANRWPAEGAKPSNIRRGSKLLRAIAGVLEIRFNNRLSLLR